MSDFVGAYEGSGGVVHRTKLRTEQHRTMARSGEPYMFSDNAHAGFLGVRVEPHVAALIQNWCEAHSGGGSSGALVRLLSTPSVPVAADTVARMLCEVQSFVDPLPSLKNIRLVARKSERNRKCIQESDVVSVLTLVIGGALELRCKYLMLVEEEQERKKKKQ